MGVGKVFVVSVCSMLLLLLLVLFLVCGGMCVCLCFAGGWGVFSILSKACPYFHLTM